MILHNFFFFSFFLLNFYFIKFYINLSNVLILKSVFFLFNYPIALILLILVFCIIYSINIHNVYIKNYLNKLEKIKNFSFFWSVFLFVYLYAFYILFFFKNVFISYIYNWVFLYKEFIFTLDVSFSIDIITIFFLLLTAMIFPLIFYYNNFFKKNYHNVRELDSHCDIFVLLFFIYFFLVLTFLSSNLFYFFVFFESSLISLFLLINFGGSKKKKYYASYSLFFFTALGSVFILSAIFIIFINVKTLNIEILINEKMDLNTQKIVTLLLFFGFSVKIPVLPFYSWLPEAHVEASAIGSVLLASILLKVGSYGILRFMLPFLKEGIMYFFNFFSIFCVFSIIISSILALMQTDLKKVIAYSSITHMNYITIGLLSYDLNAIVGSILYMVSHAFISAALFFIIGILYDNMDSREMVNFNNFNFYNPVLSFFFFFFNFANIAFPLTSSFIAELLIFSGFMKINKFLVLILIYGLFLSLIYTLWLVHTLLFNKTFVEQKVVSIQLKDVCILAFLLSMVLMFGIMPAVFLSNIELSLLFYLKFNYSL